MTLHSNENIGKKGFHIPFSLNKEDICELGEKLLAPGLYQWIEIKWPCNYLGVDSASYVEGIKELVKKYDVGVSCHIPTNLDLGQTNAYMREAVINQIKECIDYAAEMKATILPIHPGTILTFDPPASDESGVKKHLLNELHNKKRKARDLTVSILKEVADYAKNYDMTIAVENLLLPQEICYQASELNEIIRLCNCENVKALYDCGHAHRVHEDVGNFVYELGRNLCHIHFNDNDGTCDLHMQMHEGNIDYNKIFKALDDINYNGAIVMETSYKSVDELIRSSEILDEYLNKRGEE